MQCLHSVIQLLHTAVQSVNSFRKSCRSFRQLLCPITELHKAIIQFIHFWHKIFCFPGSFRDSIAILQCLQDGLRFRQFSLQIKIYPFICLSADIVDRVSGNKGHHPGKLRVVGMKLCPEGFRQIHLIIHTGNCPSNQCPISRFFHYSRIFGRNAGYAFFRENYCCDCKSRMFTRRGISDFNRYITLRFGKL